MKSEKDRLGPFHLWQWKFPACKVMVILPLLLLLILILC